MNDVLVYSVFIGFNQVSSDRNHVLDVLGFMFDASGNIYKDTVRKTDRRVTLGIL